MLCKCLNVGDDLFSIQRHDRESIRTKKLSII